MTLDNIIQIPPGEREEGGDKGERSQVLHLFSNSSFAAASHRDSLSSFASKASFIMVRAPFRSPASHFSLAAMSHKTSACNFQALQQSRSLQVLEEVMHG